MFTSTVDTLTHKQRQFCRHYVLTDGNATESARRAGYSMPEKSGYRVLHSPKVQMYLARYMQENAMQADEVLMRLSDVARGSFEDFMTIGDDGDVQLDISKARNAGKLHLLKQLDLTKDGLKISIHDPVKALQLLGQYHGLFSQSIKIEEMRQGQGGEGDLLPMGELVQALQEADKVIEGEYD